MCANLKQEIEETKKKEKRKEDIYPFRTALTPGYVDIVLGIRLRYAFRYISSSALLKRVKTRKQKIPILDGK